MAPNEAIGTSNWRRVAAYLALCAGVAQKKGAAKEIDALAAPEHMDLAGPRLLAT